MLEPDQETALSLEGELTSYQAAELKLRLVDFVARAQAPCPDLSAVIELDTAGLQRLLLSLPCIAPRSHP